MGVPPKHSSQAFLSSLSAFYRRFVPLSAGSRDKPPMRRKHRQFGAFAGASVLPISRTSSGASRASGCPVAARRNSPFRLVLPQAAKASLFGRLLLSPKSLATFRGPHNFGRQPNPLNSETESEIMSKQRRRDTTLTIRLTKSRKRTHRTQCQTRRAQHHRLSCFAVSGNAYPCCRRCKTVADRTETHRQQSNQTRQRSTPALFRSYNFEDMIDGQKMIYEQLLSIARKG